jgi:hypothetical protein
MKEIFNRINLSKTKKLFAKALFSIQPFLEKGKKTIKTFCLIELSGT